jgi:pantoate--beta-alanine ligase
MRLAVTREQLWGILDRWRRDGERIALVPTMGNLHAGHLALVHAARQSAERVVTSIYVNPTQFGAGEDFEQYPRTLDSDRQKLEAAGCDLVFAPGPDAVYPGGIAQAVKVSASPNLAQTLEGRHRPGHFDGVVTVVARLFNLVYPDVAVFGEKDYQQLLVIRHMTDELGYPTKILAVPTVREDGGLAMSSRNGYLDESQRTSATRLNGVLAKVAADLEKPGACPETLERAASDRLTELGFRVDYVAVRRSADLAEPEEGDRHLRVLAAAWCGGTRLIDNLPATFCCN